MTTIQARRRLIVIVLLCVAAGGALLRHFAAPGSTARDVGTLLMVLWLPVIGSVVAWLFAKLRRTAPGAADSSDFEARSAFHPHALVELTMRASQLPSEDVPIAEGEYRCALVVDNWLAPRESTLELKIKMVVASLVGAWWTLSKATPGLDPQVPCPMLPFCVSMPLLAPAKRPESASPYSRGGLVCEGSIFDWLRERKPLSSLTPHPSSGQRTGGSSGAV